MTISILILTIGIPGSGKSTWVQQYYKTHAAITIFSSDDIRDELNEQNVDEVTKGLHSPMIHDEIRKRIKKLLASPPPSGMMGWEIVVDATNTDIEEWRKYRELGTNLMFAKVFDVTPEEAKFRISRRNRKVPEYVIDEKYEELKKNKPYMQFFFNMIDYHESLF